MRPTSTSPGSTAPTPAGVGAVLPGDVLVGRIEGLGEITLTVGQPE